jgi:hypothetical protein
MPQLPFLYAQERITQRTHPNENLYTVCSVARAKFGKLAPGYRVSDSPKFLTRALRRIPEIFEGDGGKKRGQADFDKSACPLF